MLLFNLCVTYLELPHGLRLSHHKVDLRKSGVLIGKCNNVAVAIHQLSRHRPNHIGPNPLKTFYLYLTL